MHGVTSFVGVQTFLFTQAGGSPPELQALIIELLI
jgi:hypothetical protein